MATFSVLLSRLSTAGTSLLVNVRMRREFKETNELYFALTSYLRVRIYGEKYKIRNLRTMQ